MSMIMNYRRITPQKMAELQAAVESDPDAVGRFLYVESDQLVSDDELEKRYEAESDTRPYLDIDKSWHAIHFLLTGSAWEGEAPLANTVLGGTELGDEDVGYGVARYLTPDEVREVSEALGAITPEELMQRSSPQEMQAADIYPNIWDRGEDELEYVREYYDMLVRFFRGAAEAGEAMLLYFN
jgi:hypothetical protein